jgi:hypothetical protein
VTPLQVVRAATGNPAARSCMPASAVMLTTSGPPLMSPSRPVICSAPIAPVQRAKHLESKRAHP